MSYHTDTLKIYFDLKKAGFTDDQAEAQAKSMDNTLSQILSEFASNKLVAFFGTIIIGIGSFTLLKVWDLSHDMVEVKTKLELIERK